MMQFVIIIATFQRSNLLKLLLHDILIQTIIPKAIIIVDGDPACGEVLAMLTELKTIGEVPIFYIPSNHGNLAYQRYLGWKCASELEPEFLFYFDDDIRFRNQDTLKKLLAEFKIPAVVGVTASIITGSPEKFSNEPVLAEMRRGSKSLWLVARFGTAERYPAGGFTPVGNRIPPAENVSSSKVQWLQGRVMAYRMSSLDESCFLEDLFALTHIHCGLGEDSILSRQVGKGGDLMMVRDLNIEHPDDAMPNSYPIKAYRFGFAFAYSRRFINDHFRVDGPPHLSDRIELIKSYLGINFVNAFQAMTNPARYRWAYAWGYFCGSLRGLLQKPTAQNLTPDIDWWHDAEEALAQLKVLS